MPAAARVPAEMHAAALVAVCMLLPAGCSCYCLLPVEHVLLLLSFPIWYHWLLLCLLLAPAIGMLIAALHAFLPFDILPFAAMPDDACMSSMVVVADVRVSASVAMHHDTCASCCLCALCGAC